MINQRLKILENKVFKKTMMYQDQIVNFYTNFESIHIDRETIILLHPAFSDYRIFITQFEAWEDKYNLIAIDLIGHGRNNTLKNITIGSMPEVIERILDFYCVKEPHIIGVSLGSIVAQGIADYVSVKSVTLVGGYSIHKMNEKILKSQNKEMIKWLFLLLFAMKKFRKYVTKVSSNSIEGKQIFLLGANLFVRKSFMAMQDMQKLFRKTDDIMPYKLLIVVGDQDLKIAIDHGRDLSKIEPNSQYVVIKNAGHCAHIDQADVFNDVYEKFLNAF